MEEVQLLEFIKENARIRWLLLKNWAIIAYDYDGPVLDA